MNPYASIAKGELESLKTRYLKDLTNPRMSPILRGTVQTELSLINAAIKAINVGDARRLKADADRKAAAGLAEFQSQSKRAIAKQDSRGDLPAATERPEIQGSRDNLHVATATTPILGKPPWPKGVHSRGEFILMRAEQLQSQIKKLKSEIKPHTEVLIPQIDAFIRVQRELVAAERVARRDVEQNPRSGLQAATRAASHVKTDGTSGPTEWSETWKANASPEPVASAWPRGWPRNLNGDTTPCPVCGPEREVCFVKSDGLRCVVAGQMGPSRWHATPDATSDAAPERLTP